MLAKYCSTRAATSLMEKARVVHFTPPVSPRLVSPPWVSPPWVSPLLISPTSPFSPGHDVCRRLDAGGWGRPARIPPRLPPCPMCDATIDAPRSVPEPGMEARVGSRPARDTIWRKVRSRSRRPGAWGPRRRRSGRSSDRSGSPRPNRRARSTPASSEYHGRARRVRPSLPDRCGLPPRAGRGNTRNGANDDGNE